jgi:hypothetical protein
MLHKHVADAVVGEVGIDGLAAEFGERLEVFAESPVAIVLGQQQGLDGSGEVFYLGGELVDGVFPVGDVGLLMIEEELEDVNEFFGVGEVTVEGDAAVLIEDGASWRLEEGVGEGITFGDLGLDLTLQVVGGVLGLPDAVLEGEFVDEGSVGSERLLVDAFEVVLLDEVPAVGRSALLEKVGEGGSGVALGDVAVFVELGEGFRSTP